MQYPPVDSLPRRRHWLRVLVITAVATAASLALTALIVVVAMGHEWAPAVWLPATLAPMLIAPLTAWPILSLTYALDAAHAALREVAGTDPLTQLLHRGRFTELFQHDLAQAAQRGTTPALLILDLDHFKQVNDQHGHAAGDALLRAVARTLCERVRDGDRVARWGGEEFVVGLGAHTGDELPALGQRLCEAIAAIRLPLADGTTLGTSASLGGARWRGPGDSLDALLLRADAALYRAKQAGRNRLCLTDDPAS
ncbi:GGDEF domain-containing protein [Ideonella sp. 4Y16]|uniref:GGDEF domain-containing protein n=1 Tax=Ideonella alba TaxID=2824118 RepID=UPI001B391405|nr:GGDEF domain-containing protein [Ideonella alba]MBQ0943494.1 GGDEF domain-containing protein [Ideonella alba]